MEARRKAVTRNTSQNYTNSGLKSRLTKYYFTIADYERSYNAEYVCSSNSKYFICNV